MLISAFLEFHPERITMPNVIIGLVVIIIGIIVLVSAKSIAKVIYKEKYTIEKITIIKFLSLAIVIIGCLIAVINT